MMQKACVLVRVALVGIALTAAAVTASAQTFETGVKVGLAITGMPNAGQVMDQVVKGDSSETTSRSGLAFGGYIRFPLTDKIGFQPEAMFVMKGVKLSEKNNGG